MTVKTLRDCLPPGWVRDFRFQKSGRRIKVVKSTVDDLPSGWIKEVEFTRTANGVRKDPYYTDPASRYIFRSKKSVLRYLETGEITGRALLRKKGNGDQILTKAAKSVVKSTVGDLPSGWITEVKITRNANGVRKDKYYTDPASGYVFRSKTSVLRYLETGEITGGAYLRKKSNYHQILAKADESVVVEKSTVDDLLSRCIKEAKIKENANGVRKDKYYIDPVSGYVFRSKPSALHYLETGEITGRAFLRKKGNDDQVLTTADESTAVKENERPEWLPKNWLMEVKTRKSGVAIGKQFKVVVEKSTLDDLPSGWIMEVKIKRDTNEVRKDSRLPAAKRRKVKHLANRRQLVIGRETSNKSILSDLETETFEEGQTNNSFSENGLATSSMVRIPQTKGPVENASKRNPETTEKSCKSSSVAREASNRKQSEIVSADNVLVSTVEADETEERSSMNSKNSGKSKNNNELGLPRGVLNLLYRLEHEQVASGLEHVKPCQNEATEDDGVLGNQPRMLEMEKTSGTNSEVHPLLSSDPCLGFTTKTLRGGVQREDAADEDLFSTPASSIPQEKNRGKTRKKRKRSNTGTKNSGKSKKIKELDLPHRFSKRLAGLETELVSNEVSTEVAIQNATRKYGKTEAKPLCVLVDEETRQLNVGRNATLPNQASPAAVNPEINNISPHEDKAMLAERPQLSRTKKSSDRKSEVEPFFCSESCLEFGIKTLTGAIPSDDSINEGLVSTPIANIQQQKNVADTRIEHSRCRKSLFNSTRSKKDASLHQRSSKRVAEHAPEPVTSSSSNEQVLNFADRKSSDNKAIRNVDLTSAELTEKSSQQLETGPRMAYRTTLFHDESSNKSKEPRNNETIPAQMNNENPGQQSTFPSWSSWSDPRFKSPFRSVADSSPAQGSFAFQRNLPDRVLPNIFRSDITSHVDRTGQPVMQQSCPCNVSLPSSCTIGAQQSSRKGKRNCQELPDR